MPPATGDHAARVAAAAAWLESQCGDYAPLRRQFIAALPFPRGADRGVSRGAGRACEADTTDFAPEDFCGLPCVLCHVAGWPAGSGKLPADLVFWDGTQAIAVEVAARDTESSGRCWAGAPVSHRAGCIRTARRDAAEQFSFGWVADILPTSPFRRAIAR